MKRILMFSGMGCGGILLSLIILVVVAVVLENGIGTTSNTNASGAGQATGSSAPDAVRIERLLSEIIQKGFNENKQQVFDRIHPIGTAKSVTLHDVTVIEWKDGHDTNQIEIVLQFTVRYTLFWEGPITTDGYTKITQTYDTETKRYISGQILATNGITNRDAGEAVGALIGTWLQYEAERAGAEQAVRQYLNR